MKQVGPGSETVPPSASTLILGERGQPASEVGLVIPSAHSSVLAKRKLDDGTGSSNRKKSKTSRKLDNGAEESATTALASTVVMPLFIIVAHLLSVSVATTSTPVVPLLLLQLQ